MSDNRLPARTIKRIHVNRHWVRDRRPNALRIKTGSGANIPAAEVQVHGPSSIVYRPDRPLACGAKAWIETRAEVSWTVEEDGTDLASKIIEK